MNITRTAVAFFYANAGYSYNPATETKRQARTKHAMELANAEDWARSNLSFEWEVDQDVDSSEFSEERPRWSLWVCIARDEAADQVRIAAILCGIDFGRGGEPWGQPYKRVVEAELALEVMP